LALQAAFGGKQVDVRAVTDIVSVLFEPKSQREFERQELAGTHGQRVVHDTGELRFTSVRSVETDIGPRALCSFGMSVDRIVAWPAVVRLPRVIGTLEKNIGRAFIADDEHNVTLPIRFGTLRNSRHAAEVHAARPILRNGQFSDWLPPAF